MKSSLCLFRHVPGAFVRSPHLAAGVHVLDLLYVALTVALFAIVGLLAKGVERL
ncbi:MAG: hypothetical protein ABWY37_00805 [Microbacterium pygmaeum]